MNATGVKDLRGKPILEGDVIADNIPSKGIVVEVEQGVFVVTSNYNSRDIRQIGHSDVLCEDLVRYNEMVVIGNIHDTPDIV